MYKQDIFKEYMKVCSEGYRMNWHEGNGGNLTYRLKADEVEDIKEDLIYNEDWIDLGVNVGHLVNEYFIVTGSGVYFSNVNECPEKSITVIQVNDQGDKYRILANKEDVIPTSELPAHLLTHNIKIKNGLENRTVYHAHTTNLIALTFVLPLDSSVFTKALWRMSSECAVVFPEGIGVLEWMVPGQAYIAEKTAEAMADRNIVLWANHGTFCSADSPMKAFGLMNTVEKAAEIMIKILSTNKDVLQTITDENLVDLSKRFNVDLSKEIK